MTDKKDLFRGKDFFFSFSSSAYCFQGKISAQLPPFANLRNICINLITEKGNKVWAFCTEGFFSWKNKTLRFFLPVDWFQKFGACKPVALVIITAYVITHNVLVIVTTTPFLFLRISFLRIGFRRILKGKESFEWRVQASFLLFFYLLPLFSFFFLTITGKFPGVRCGERWKAAVRVRMGVASTSACSVCIWGNKKKKKTNQKKTHISLSSMTSSLRHYLLNNLSNVMSLNERSGAMIQRDRTSCFLLLLLLFLLPIRNFLHVDLRWRETQRL